MQRDQEVLQKQQRLNAISEIDSEIAISTHELETACVDENGSISDFEILQIHKNSMKAYIANLKSRKKRLLEEVEEFNKKIIELQKESEQFDYLLKRQKREEMKIMLKDEELAASEYIQAKWALK